MMLLSAGTESSQPTKHKEPLYYSAAQIFTTIQNPHKKRRRKDTSSHKANQEPNNAAGGKGVRKGNAACGMES
jgi:hypothetical protein